MKPFANPRPRKVRHAPVYIYSRSFRRYFGAMSPDETLLIERLERQRQLHHRVRAFVADPGRKYSRIISAYIHWLQTYIHPGTDTLVGCPRISTAATSVSPSRHRLPHSSLTPFRQLPGATIVGGRSPLSCHGQPKCVHQCVILDADIISPSRPYRSSRLDTMHCEFIGTLPLGDSALILLGDPWRRRRNRYRQLWQQMLQRSRIYADSPYQHIDPAESAATHQPRELHPPACSLPEEILPAPATCADRTAAVAAARRLHLPGLLLLLPPRHIALRA